MYHFAAGLWLYYSSTVGKTVACAAGLLLYYSSTQDVFCSHSVRYYSHNHLSHCTVYCLPLLHSANCRTATVCCVHIRSISTAEQHTVEIKRHGCLSHVVSYEPMQWLQNGSTITVLVSLTNLYCVITQQIRIWTLSAVTTPTCSIGRRCCTHLLNRKAMLHPPAPSQGNSTPTTSFRTPRTALSLCVYSKDLFLQLLPQQAPYSHLTADSSRHLFTVYCVM